jgi:TrmH family RNA methyltransferase
MKNFNLKDLWIVNPKVPLDGEARAYAAHGVEILERARIVNDLEEATAGVELVVGSTAIPAKCSSNLIISITPFELAKKIQTISSIAILFGRESSGLRNEELQKCDLVVTIPTDGTYRTLNVATAASIIFYELYKSNWKNDATQSSLKPAGEDIRKQLTERFSQMCEMSGIPSHKKKLAERAFRNILARSVISRREASLLLGVFRRTLSKLMRPDLDR